MLGVFFHTALKRRVFRMRNDNGLEGVNFAVQIKAKTTKKKLSYISFARLIKPWENLYQLSL